MRNLKTLLAILLCFFFFQQSAFGQIDRKAARYEIKKTTLSSISPSSRSESFKVFDRKGRIIEEQEIDLNSSEKTRVIYSYDKNLIREDHFKNDSLLYAITNEYQFKKLVLKTKKSPNGQAVIIEKNSWNKWGDKEEELQFDKNGELKKRSIYTYNNKGLLVKKQVFNSKGDLLQEKSTEYEYH